jgi:hypothetical protein
MPMRYFALKPPNFVFASIKPPLNQSLALTKGGEVPVLGASSSPEANGTWGIGTWFGIAVDVGNLPVASSANLLIEVSCFRHAKDPTPKIGCYANGRHIVDIDFPEGRDEGRANIFVGAKGSGESHRLEIWFNNPRAASPASLGISKDSRCLSLLLKSVTLEA